jgi:tRNA dimethylallyltransferase
MYAEGLLEEVRGLMGRGLESAPTAFQAIGYAEAVDCLSGALTVPAAQEETFRRTWQLARRQMTWFRNQSHIRWLDIEADLPADAVADRVRKVWAETGPIPLK